MSQLDNVSVCRVKLPGAADWRTVRAGESFEVPGNAAFEIETLEMLDYVCHFKS